MSTLHEGDRISNYLLEESVGSGSFGEVWRARHHVFGDQIVAIKVPTDAQYVRNLQREGTAIHGLKHPNIVRAIDLDPYATPPYLIMEYIEGPSLREAIDKLGSDFPISAAVTIARGILSALVASHATGLIHRDIKPANILLACPIDRLASIIEQQVKVTDFGLGRIGGETTQSIFQSGQSVTEGGRSIAGTVAYMSPEQKKGTPLDGRSDLYACGIVLFEMLTGERPQGHDLPSQLRQDVPKKLDSVFDQSYARLERRYDTAEQMLAELSALNEPTAQADTQNESRSGGSVGYAETPPPPIDSSAENQKPPPVFARAVPIAEPPIRRCPSCRADCDPDDQFCIDCGFQLVEKIPRCPRCNAFVHRTDRYCTSCGNELRVIA